jgi:fibronectin type 3 domain-containing protein
MFSRLPGVRIKKIENGINYIDYNTVNKHIEYNDNYIFEIESNKEKYYIAASFVKVFENKLDFSESSLKTREKGVEIATSLS